MRCREYTLQIANMIKNAHIAYLSPAIKNTAAHTTIAVFFHPAQMRKGENIYRNKSQQYYLCKKNQIFGECLLHIFNNKVILPYYQVDTNHRCGLFLADYFVVILQIH